MSDIKLFRIGAGTVRGGSVREGPGPHPPGQVRARRRMVGVREHARLQGRPVRPDPGEQVAIVQWRSAGLTAGQLSLVMSGRGDAPMIRAGGRGAKAATTDPNTITFHRHRQRDFERVRDAIQAALSAPAPVQVAAAPAPPPPPTAPAGMDREIRANDFKVEAEALIVQGVPRLLAELEEDGENADYWRQRANELGAELDELRSAVRSLFTHGGQMVSAAPGTYRNLWSLVANNTDTCRGPDGQATRTETNQ